MNLGINERNKTHPKKWTYENIANMKKELQSLNLDLDWDREFATCDELYYKHQQGLFVDFYKNGLALQEGTLLKRPDLAKTLKLIEDAQKDIEYGVVVVPGTGLTVNIEQDDI